jgi:transposase
MAAKPIAMEQLKQVLHLYRNGQSIKGIVRLTGLSRNTVRTYIGRSNEADCDGSAQSNAELAATLYNQDIPRIKSQRLQQLLPLFEGVDKELSRPGVTRQLLWREYKEQHADGYTYSLLLSATVFKPQRCGHAPGIQAGRTSYDRL